jgi:DNA-binding CsgD family transcriptional regulator
MERGRQSRRPDRRDEDILLALYRGSMEAPPWRSFLSALAARLQADHAVIIMQHARTEIEPLIFWSSYPLSARSPVKPDAKDGRVVNARLGSSTFRDVPDTCQRIFETLGLRLVANKLVRSHEGWDCFVTALNAECRPDPAQPELALLSWLQPHLDNALQLFSSIHNRDLEVNALRQSLERLSFGVIFTDCLGGVFATNRVAQEMIDNGELRISLRRLHLTDSKSDAALQTIISETLCGVRRDAALAARGRNGQPLDLLIRTMNVRPVETGSLTSLVIYIDNRHFSSTPEALLQELFDLTRSESKVAALIASGESTAETAQHLGLTEYTVRSYIKSVFEKVGVCRQAELVRIVTGSVATL